MTVRGTSHFDRAGAERVSRRGILAAAAGAGVVLIGGRRAAEAQDASPAAGVTGAPLPANAAAWPKYNLDTTPVETFAAVAGDRMSREFVEYRPYAGIGEFRAEIGKYVSPEDVAALEASVFVPVDPNAADADTLRQLPGVTAEVADRLVAARPFADAAAFLAALGDAIGPDWAALAAGFLAPDAGVVAAWPKFDLNAVTEDQLAPVPGASGRMFREFEEYRPYASIGQFRGEIGKYVSPEDVAALEAYLFVPVDPNGADADTLRQLPGVSAQVAEALIAARPFADAGAFLAVLGGLVAPEQAAAAGGWLVR